MACGCKESFIGLFIGVAISVRYLIWSAPDLYSQTQQILAACGIGLAGAVIGKALGLAWARYRDGTRS